jgi:hypothetical protein
LNTSATLLGWLADDLKPFQKIVTSAGGFGERMLSKAAREVYQAKDWPFVFGSFTLNTGAGTQAYSIPGSVTDFDGFPREERVTNYWAYDTLSRPLIPDSSSGQKYPFTYNQGTGQLEFPYNPGAGSLTVFYRKKYGGLTAFASWPEKLEDIVMERAAFHLLHRSVGQDARAKAVEFFNNSERMIKEVWIQERKGQTLPAGRDPVGPLGDAIFYAFNGDD